MTPNERIESLREKGFTTEEATRILFNPENRTFYTMHPSFDSGIIYKPENKKLNSEEVTSWLYFYSEYKQQMTLELFNLRKEIADLKEENNSLKLEIADLNALNIPENGV